MADNSTPNFPDVLGYITGGNRYNVGVVQLALAVRPRVVRAGRPFEVIMLIQNASDVEVDLAVKLHIPERDANKKKGRFVAKVDRLMVGLQAAEVGYVTLPISCVPDTAISPDYRVGMEMNAKTLDKPQRVRHPNGGGKIEPADLNDEAREKVEELKALSFDADKRSGLRSTAFEVSFSVMSGRVGTFADLEPGWVSLWTMKDHLDDRVLMQKYWETLKNVVLPVLGRDTVYKPLLEETTKRFSSAGYPLKPVEATFITKLLTLMIEYAAPSSATHGSHGYLIAGIYNIQPLLTRERMEKSEPFVLPRWISGMLRAIVQDERAARYPAIAITQVLYHDLIADAAAHAFSMVETATGEDLGDDKEIQAYINQLLDILQGNMQPSFTYVYLPLILGGIIVYDRVILEDEKVMELLRELSSCLSERRTELRSDSDPVYQMALKLIDQAMMKYGQKGT